MKIPVKKSDILYEKSSILPSGKKFPDALTSNNSKNSQPSSNGWNIGFERQNENRRGWGANISNESLNKVQSSKVFKPAKGWGNMPNDNIGKSNIQKSKFNLGLGNNSSFFKNTPNFNEEKKLDGSAPKKPSFTFSFQKIKEDSTGKIQLAQGEIKPKFHFGQIHMNQKELDSKFSKVKLNLNFGNTSSKKQLPDKIPISNEKLIKIIIKRLLKVKNLDINCQTADFSLLSYACENNEKKIVTTLLDSNRCDVNQYVQRNGNSPLMTAIFNKNFEIAELLILLPSTNINHQNY